MKALSLWPVYAAAMLVGVKRIETRGFYTAHRGPLLVCSTLGGPDSIGRMDEWWLQPEPPPRGMALVVVDVVDCIPTTSVPLHLSDHEHLLGDYTPGRYAWITENRRPLGWWQPIKGKQGLFDVLDSYLHLAVEP